ncbi:hypothetical protein [Deinococcus sp.]|uniref:hypothetical protein n=1 Tax=Deinococcus sp. TaxID=47478 RepID=UPI0025B9D443|nr:hypothetical protein [Deinococcus sp.]
MSRPDHDAPPLLIAVQVEGQHIHLTVSGPDFEQVLTFPASMYYHLAPRDLFSAAPLALTVWPEHPSHGGAASAYQVEPYTG